jgi:hypothetical protein
MDREVVAAFGPARKVIETDDEFVLVGHQNAAGEFPEERFPKLGHRIEVTETALLVIAETV